MDAYYLEVQVAGFEEVSARAHEGHSSVANTQADHEENHGTTTQLILVHSSTTYCHYEGDL